MGKYEQCKQVMQEYFTLYSVNTERFDKWINLKIEQNKKFSIKKHQENKRKFYDFVFLSQEEYNKLIEELGEANVKELIHRLNHYIGSTGKQYKSHFRTIRNRAKRGGVKKPKQEEAEQPLFNPPTEEEKRAFKVKLESFKKKVIFNV